MSIAYIYLIHLALPLLLLPTLRRLYSKGSVDGLNQGIQERQYGQLKLPSTWIKRAGMTDFRFHDLRHIWASWLIQSGVPLSALQEMGGWESIEMVQRYADLALNHLTAHAHYIDSIF